VASSEVLIELVCRHVFFDREELTESTLWPDGCMLHTSARDFLVAPADGWLITGEPWVEALIVATRQDLEVEGLPETDGILLLADGGSIHLNDAGAVAELGRRVGRDLAPEAFAEILVQWHPPSAAAQFLLRDPGHARRAFDRPDLPEFAGPVFGQTGDRFTGTFHSARQHAGAVGGALVLDVLAWTVTVPAGAPASWDRRPVLEGVPLERLAL